MHVPLISCFLCTSSCSLPVEEDNNYNSGDPTSSSNSTSSANPSSSSDTASIQTFPSLPSLHSLIPLSSQATPPYSFSFSLLSSLNSTNNSNPSLATTSSSPHFLYSASQSSISVFDLTTSTLPQLHSIPSLHSSGAVKSIIICNSSTKLFTAHQDGKIQAWSVNSGKLRRISSLPTLTDKLRRFPFPSNYRTIRRHNKRLWIQHADAVSAIAVHDSLLYTVSWDKTLKVWNTRNLRCMESITAHDDAINAVAVGMDGVVYTGSADKRIRVWERRGGCLSLIVTLEKHKSAVNALAVSEDGMVVYSGACDRSVLVWEREESAGFMVVVGALRGHGKAVMCIVTLGGMVFSGSSDGTVRAWRRGATGDHGYSCLGVIEGNVRGVRSLAGLKLKVEDEEEEEFRICSGSLDGEVRVWRVRVSNRKGSDLG